jgi:hypothetical protein
MMKAYDRIFRIDFAPFHVFKHSRISEKRGSAAIRVYETGGRKDKGWRYVGVAARIESALQTKMVGKQAKQRQPLKFLLNVFCPI